MSKPALSRSPAVSEQAPLNVVLHRVANELDRLAREGDRLQSCLGGLALRSADPALAVDLQSIDRLVQHLHGVSGFLQTVAEGVPVGAKIDIGPALDAVTLGDLAKTLAGEPPARAVAPPGLFELL